MQGFSALSILVVDDDIVILKVLGHMLGHLGFTAVTAVDSGEDALEQLNAGPMPQLIFLDINMPSIDGVEFIRTLVTVGYSGALILVSGETERTLETVEKLARARGINVLGYLQKPVLPEALASLLATLKLPALSSVCKSPKTVYDSNALRAAIANGELVNYFQPKVSVETGEFVGAEVLVRWRHPDDGLVYPDHFIPLAEESGLMPELTSAVLSSTFRQIRLWQDAGLQVKPAINISMDNLNTLSFPDDLAALAADAGISTHGMLLEVTESQLIQNLATVLDTLIRLHLKRVNLAIDDFGTGYSSLAQLSDLPFDQLKIDKRFVHGAASNATTKAIFIASREMGTQLGMEVVAEGVEDRADWDWLRQVGCDVAQGHFVARPMPPEDFPDWLSLWQKRIVTEDLLSKPQGRS